MKEDVLMDRRGASVLCAFIDAIDWSDVLSAISGWASRNESRYVRICNVHSVVTAAHDTEFGHVVNEADMATPDGAPVAWMLRRLGYAAWVSTQEGAPSPLRDDCMDAGGRTMQEKLSRRLG